VQASYRLLFAASPPAVSTHRSPDAARSRRSSKSTLAHDAVATALPHMHHPIIHVDAGPIQLVYASHSGLAVELILDKILFSPLIWRDFQFGVLQLTSKHTNGGRGLLVCLIV